MSTINSDCPVLRRKLVTSYSLNIMTGERSDKTEAWVTEPCGTPLFGEIGMCRSCAKGWSVPGNYPAAFDEQHLPCRCGVDVRKCRNGCRLWACCGGYVNESHMTDCPTPSPVIMEGVA